MDYFIHILVLIGIYIIASTSLNLLAGYTGLLSLSHAAFYGIGAYVVALMGLNFGTPFWINLPFAMLLSTLIGLIVAVPSLRLHGDYFVLTTFGFQVIATSVMLNWLPVTGGPIGLLGIPRPELFGFRLSENWQMACLVWAAAALSFLLLSRLVRSPFGIVLRAIREDEIFAESLGKHVKVFKIKAYLLSVALVAMAGGFFSVYMTFIDYSSFTVGESILMLTIVIVGGAGNLGGSVAGAIVLVALPEVLRLIGLPSAIAANLRQILYGGLLVLIMVYRPQGILGKFAFRRE